MKNCNFYFSSILRTVFMSSCACRARVLYVFVTCYSRFGHGYQYICGYRAFLDSFGLSELAVRHLRGLHSQLH